MNKKIIILDLSTTTVYIFSYDDNVFEDISEFLIYINKKEDLNLRESECDWMITNDDCLNIEIR